MIRNSYQLKSDTCDACELFGAFMLQLQKSFWGRRMPENYTLFIETQADVNVLQLCLLGSTGPVVVHAPDLDSGPVKLKY